MAKVLIWVVLGALIGALGILVILAGLNPPIESTKDDFIVVEQPVIEEPMVEKVPIQPIIVEADDTPSPRAEDIVDVTPDFASLTPQEVRFWVNEVMAPPYSESYYNFLPLKQHDLKTFAGAFGPYAVDPRQYLSVKLCSEMYNMPTAPACMPVRLSFSGGSVSFAVGLQWDEFIGGMAAKDYLAYYTVFSGDAVVAQSNKAMIRTIKD